VQTLDEIARDELLGGNGRELLVEPQHERRIEPGAGEQVDLLLDADHLFRAVLRRNRRERVAVEGDRDGARVGLDGIEQHVVDDRAVTGVHPVELADRDDRVAEVGGQFRRILDDDHAATFRRCEYR
jgi:hypothetical protein